MKKLSELLTFLTFDWYRKGPTDYMSKSKIIFGLILSIVIFLVALTAKFGILLRVIGSLSELESPASTTVCLLGKWYYKDLNYNDGYNLKYAPIEVWDFQTNSTFILRETVTLGEAGKILVIIRSKLFILKLQLKMSYQKKY